MLILLVTFCHVSSSNNLLNSRKKSIVIFHTIFSFSFNFCNRKNDDTSSFVFQENLCAKLSLMMKETISGCKILLLAFCWKKVL